MENKSIPEVGVDKTNVYVHNQNVSYIRKTIFICIILYSSFALVDLILYSENISLFFIIRFGVVVPFMVLIFLLSFTKFFKKIDQLLLIILYLVSGAGIVVMIFIVEGENYYTNGLYLLFAVGFYLLRLKGINSIIAFLLVLGLFIVIGEYSQTLSSISLYTHAFFYLTFALIGIFGSFFNDRYLKEQFEYERNTEQKSKELKYQIHDQLNKINTAHKSTIISIAKLAESRDTLTGDHLSRVARMSLMFASAIPEEIFISNDTEKEGLLETIELTSILHDIGKIAVSDKILNKPGKLTDDEYETIKTHTSIGAETLTSIVETDNENQFVTQGIEIAKHHHERWDGSGYPSTLKGTDIPLSARIVSIIDVYDALISKRPYKEKYSKEQSLKIIKNGRGTQFDPNLTDVFVKMAEESNDVELFWK